jgi:hypothetical protein
MKLVEVHTHYNPSRILSDMNHRDEYDFLFSRKQGSSTETFLSTTLNRVKEVGSGIVEVFTGNNAADPARLGEMQRVSTQYAAGFQSCLGIAKVLTGDVYSGGYNALLGVLGVNCSREGKSKDMLKTYLVISFINGCVQVMEVVQMSLAGIPIFGHGMPLLIGAGHIISLLNPCASFIGAYLGWQYIKATKQQYLLSLAQYQLQMLMMHQQQQMMQATVMQQKSLKNPKRLAPIDETSEESGIPEGTGGSHNQVLEDVFEDGGSTVLAE